MLTLASLTKTAKRFALDASVSDEAFLNALVEPLVAAGRVRARGGGDYHLDKSRTSRILGGNCDVPRALRKALSRYGIEDSTAREFGAFVEESIDADLFAALAGKVAGLAGPSGEVARKLEGAAVDPERFMAIALIEAVKNDNRDSRAVPVWSSGTGSLHVEVGDILAHGFGRQRKVKQIVVIPVDTSFETEVTWTYEDSPAPLISPKSLHGKWLTRMAESGVGAEELDDRIESSLRRRGAKPLPGESPRRRRRQEYPVGTVAVIANARSVFYLLAIASLDDNNNASATRGHIADALRAMIDVYDREGQGLDTYIPLLGTGESRANLTHQESLDLIAGELTKNRGRVHGKATIVVFRDDAEKVTIPEEWE